MRRRDWGKKKTNKREKEKSDSNRRQSETKEKEWEKEGKRKDKRNREREREKKNARKTRQVTRSRCWTIIKSLIIFNFFFPFLLWLCLAFSVLLFFFLFFFFLFHFFFAVSDLSVFETSKPVLSNFSPFCRALLPFHYCLLLTGTFLHYYQEALVWGSIPCAIYYLLATCLYLNSSDRLYHPNTRTLLRIRGRADDAT